MDKKLLDYIKTHSKRGFSYSQIEEHLVNHGWHKNDARDAINFVKGNEMLDEVKKKNYGYESPKFVRTKSSIGLMLLTFLMAAVIIGSGIFLLNSNLLTGMATNGAGQGTQVSIQDKAPVVESAKEIKTNMQLETPMKQYTISTYDWAVLDSADSRITKLSKNGATITLAQLNSNNMNLIDYFDSVYSVVLSTSGNGNEIIDVSDAVIGGKKVKKLLRKYQQDGQTTKLLQVYFENNGYIYLVNYESEQVNFDKNMNSANTIIDSISFV